MPTITRAVAVDHQRLLDLAAPRALAAGALLNDGRWLVAGGGQGPAPIKPIAGTERVNLRTAVRTAGPALADPRHSHTATRLSNGKVLILGGTDSAGQPLASAEIFE
jgi:hypothetical protein